MSPNAPELVLSLLQELSGTEVNAQDLALKLGYAPAELHAAVEELRSRGYEILHTDQRGYRLGRRPESRTLAERLPPTLSLGAPLTSLDECTSTNELLRQQGDAGARHGTTVVARRQSAGRGRRGRSWLSPDGDTLALSVLLEPELPAERLSELTLVAGVALAEALESFEVRAELKWPNDLEIEGRKVAGILSELCLRPGSAEPYVIVGVGVNVDVPPDAFPEELRQRATSVRPHAPRALSSAEIAAAFLTRLDEWLVLHRSMGFAIVLDAWKSRSSMFGEEVRALVDGQVLAGTAESLDSTGALVIRDAGGRLHHIVAGEVTSVRRATL